MSIGHMLPLHAQPIRSCDPDQLQVIPLENDRFRGRPGGRPAAVFEFLSLSPRSRRAAKLRASRVAHYETYSQHRMYDIELHRSFGAPCATAPHLLHTIINHSAEASVVDICSAPRAQDTRAADVREPFSEAVLARMMALVGVAEKCAKQHCISA